MASKAITMPKMSMTMTEGTVATWLKEVGDTVRAGEAICEVATDKVDMEVEAPADGVLERIVAQPDDVIPVGDPLGWLTTDAEDLLGDVLGDVASVGGVANPAAGVSSGDAAVAPGTATSDQPPAAPTTTRVERPPAVPAARRRAAEQDLALTEVPATGPGNTIRLADVDRVLDQRRAPVTTAAPATPGVPAPPTLDGVAGAAGIVGGNGAVSGVGAPAAPATSRAASGTDGRRHRTRLAVARAMATSALVPQFTAYRDLDLTALDRIRGTRLGGASWTAILLKAHAVALRTHHRLNAFWTDEGPAGNEDVAVAMAVDSEAGLLAPVLRNPDIVPLLTLGARVRAAAEAVRRGDVGADALQGGTTVFSNLGGFGVRSFNALLTPPQATALAVGAVRHDVVAGPEGSIGVRLVCTVGLTVDHRVGDGADAARLLAELDAVLADPARLGAVA